MTRQARTLLLISLLAVAAVGALATMANRYARILDGRRETAARPAPGGRASIASERLEAERLIDAWLSARRALARDGGGDLDAILAGVGLSRGGYDHLQAVHRDWLAGRPGGGALAAAMERHRSEIEALDRSTGR